VAGKVIEVEHDGILFSALDARVIVQVGHQAEKIPLAMLCLYLFEFRSGARHRRA